MTRFRFTATAAVAAAALAGCGGGDGGDSGNNQTLSYGELGTQANEICTKANAEIEPLSEKLSGEPKNDAPILEDIIATQEPAVDEFKQLKPPEQLQDAFDEFVSISDQQVSIAREAQAAAETGDADAYQEELKKLEPLDKQSDAAARSLGAEECAKS